MQELCDTLPTILNLAAAGGIDLASASDMVTDAMSALGMGTDETTTMEDLSSPMIKWNISMCFPPHLSM